MCTSCYTIFSSVLKMDKLIHNFTHYFTLNTKPNEDNYVFKIVSKVTVGILILSACVVAATQYIGNVSQCGILTIFLPLKFLREISLITDLGSLIGNVQLVNFRNFSSTLNLREINFGHFEAPKTKGFIIKQL